MCLRFKSSTLPVSHQRVTRSRRGFKGGAGGTWHHALSLV